MTAKHFQTINESITAFQKVWPIIARDFRHTRKGETAELARTVDRLAQDLEAVKSALLENNQTTTMAA